LYLLEGLPMPRVLLDDRPEQSLLLGLKPPEVCLIRAQRRIVCFLLDVGRFCLLSVLFGKHGGPSLRNLLLLEEVILFCARLLELERPRRENCSPALLLLLLLGEELVVLLLEQCEPALRDRLTVLTPRLA
jgi:hypothetical protein